MSSSAGSDRIIPGTSQDLDKLLSNYSNTQELLITKHNARAILHPNPTCSIAATLLCITVHDIAAVSASNRIIPIYNNLFPFIVKYSHTLLQLKFSKVADLLKDNWMSCLSALRATSHLQCLAFEYCDLSTTQLSELSTEGINHLTY